MNSVEIIKEIKIWIYILLWGVCWYLNLAQESVIILSILIILDFITGIIKSIRLWDDIKSKKWIIWILSKLLLILIPITIALVWKWVWVNLYVFISSCFGLLIVSEWYSVIWNITMAITGKKLKEKDSISMILEKILSIIKKILDWIIKDFKY